MNTYCFVFTLLWLFCLRVFTGEMLQTTNEYLLLCVYSTLTLLSEGLYGEKIKKNQMNTYCFVLTLLWLFCLRVFTGKRLKKKNEYLLLCAYSSLTLLSEGLYGEMLKKQMNTYYFVLTLLSEGLYGGNVNNNKWILTALCLLYSDSSIWGSLRGKG